MEMVFQAIWFIGIPIAIWYIQKNVPWVDGLELLCCVVGAIFWPVLGFLYILVWLIYQYKKWRFKIRY